MIERRGVPKHRHLILGEIGEFAGADERVLAPCDIGLALGPDPGDLVLDQSGFEGRGSAARALNPLEQVPGNAAELIGQRFDGARAGGGIGDAMNIGLLDQDGCVLRAMRRAKASGRPSAALNGSTVTASAPPTAAASAAMVPRTMFPCGSRLVIMRQAVSAATKAGRGVEPAGLLDARPELPDGAKLGDGQELILVGGEAEIDEAARIVERDAALLQRAEIGDRAREREGELLRL